MLVFGTTPKREIAFGGRTATKLAAWQAVWSIGISVIMSAFVDASKFGRTIVTLGINAIKITIDAPTCQCSANATFCPFFARTPRFTTVEVTNKRGRICRGR